nr:PREDICTED: uncharacterized protein LOC104143070 [Struthio camelus australis]
MQHHTSNTSASCEVKAEKNPSEQSFLKKHYKYEETEGKALEPLQYGKLFHQTGCWSSSRLGSSLGFSFLTNGGKQTVAVKRCRQVPHLLQTELICEAHAGACSSAGPVGYEETPFHSVLFSLIENVSLREHQFWRRFRSAADSDTMNFRVRARCQRRLSLRAAPASLNPVRSFLPEPWHSSMLIRFRGAPSNRMSASTGHQLFQKSGNPRVCDPELSNWQFYPDLRFLKAPGSRLQGSIHAGLSSDQQTLEALGTA